MKITRIGTTVDRLGEGPIWDAETQRLYWLDSLAGTLHTLDPTTGAHKTLSVPAPVGSMSLRKAGGAVLSLRDGFYGFDFESNTATLLAPLGIDNPNVRLNDGKTDRQGRFLAGTMHLHRADDEPVIGGLFRLDSGGKAVQIADDILTSNGPCFSPDGRIFYFADSTRRTIWAFDYDIETGTPHNRRVFADLTSMNTSPDGATVDAEGYVWSVLIRSSTIARFDPTGRIVQQIKMPILYPTSIAFGGKDLDVIYVTSISRSVRFADEHPDAGGLFAIEGLGIRGLAEPRCTV
ncbi:SMP-30/gluconolactonase/LRE family protein [Pseudoroseomonas wenyumeiae]|uniref:Regucalcin n=1 Tax=Teichococcus wenyumeiae TaxID=2478470 RepID=A0A3A9JEH2_9PROT|nr:SMP-30/gluconolactonase/LRE family protein [Pseudoroseomonas wenyumeiae]RKK04640.1 SMP-30/gluconolactonase/LRE family protein [Pseudoroseomonas wenyumeiae]RMI19306.1 SMP-30/gluconolactonase/LRE family protein [Pseudoroseomonas wenyumeiae]